VPLFARPRALTLLFALIALLIVGLALAAYLLNVPAILVVLAAAIALAITWFLAHRTNREPRPPQ
jgi:hypothetical protein